MLKMMNWLFDSTTNWWGRWSQFIGLPPLVLRIRITNRCNLSCHYCYVGKSLNKKVESLLTQEEWKNIFRNLSPMTLIDITGGEPLLAPGVEDLLRGLLDRKMKVSLITNGTVFKEEVFSLMVQKRLMHLMVSLDGTEAIHDSIRGKGAFAKAIKTVHKIQELKRNYQSSYPKLVAKVTLTRLNIIELEEFCSYLFNEVRFDGVTLNLLFDNAARDGFTEEENIESPKFFQGNMISFKEDEKELFVQSIKRVREIFGSRIQIRPDIAERDLAEYFRNPQKMMPHNCYKYQSVVTLYANGVMTPCDLGLNVANIRDVQFKVGNIFKHKRMESFFKFMRMRNSQDFPACGGCCLKKHEKVG